MTEVMMANRKTQVGVESTIGTGVVTTKYFQGISIEPAVKVDIMKFRPVGFKFNTIAGFNREWVSAAIKGYPTYDEIIYLLASALQYTAPVQQGATTAYLWDHTPAISSADTTKGYSIEVGDAVRAQKFYGGQVSDLGFNFARSGVTLDGTMIGYALQDGITMTGANTAIPIIPVLPTQVTVKIADSQAGLAGASALTRCISAGWKIANRWGMPWPLNSAATNYISSVESAAPALTATLRVEADSTGLGLLTQMRAGSSKWMRIKATGAQISGAYYYDFQTDLCLKVVGDPSPFEDEDGLAAITWNFEGFYDSTWTKTINCQVINTQTALG